MFSPFAARLVGAQALEVWHLIWMARLCTNSLPCSDAVFEEEAVTDGVVGHVVLNAQEVRAVHGHAAVVGVVDRRRS